MRNYITDKRYLFILSCSPAELLIGPNGPLTVRSGRHQCALEDGRWCSPLPPQLPDSTYLQCFAGDELSKSRHIDVCAGLHLLAPQPQLTPTVEIPDGPSP